MIRFFHKLLFISGALLYCLNSSSQGLQFKSNNEYITNRTSYNVFNYDTPTLEGFLSVSFDISILNPKMYGYVVNINDPLSGILFNMNYHIDGDTISYFTFSTKSQELLLEVPITKSEIGEGQWQNVIIKFDPKKDSIFVSLDNKSYSVQRNISHNSFTPVIFFGKHDSYIDVPSMAIRNLKVSSSRKSFNFRFAENAGNGIHDTKGKLWGKVENPIWLINNHYFWNLKKEITSNKVTAICFDDKNQRFLILNRDSLLIYSIKTNLTSSIELKQKTPVKLRLGMCFYNSVDDKLYVYEVNDVEEGEPSIASLNLNDYSWTINSYDQLPMQKHHHNSYFDRNRNEFVLFGGYGNRKYSNEFYRLRLSKTNLKWEKVNFMGDTIIPRFFSGMAVTGKNDLVIFGGVGNPAGIQDIGKVYYSDCYLVNAEQHKIKKLWGLSNKGYSLVSGRSMILSEDSNYFFTIQYPEYKSKTYLKLYRYRIKDGINKVLSDSVLMISERIRTNANVYLDKISNHLLLVTQEFQLDGSSKATFYSIAYPPVSKDDFFKVSDTSFLNLKLVLLIIVFIIVVIFVIFKSYKKRHLQKHKKTNNIYSTVADEKKDSSHARNALFLFGGFIVLDYKGRDVSYLFSPKIKQLFLMIYLNSFENKITSNEINSVLWPYKNLNSAKNIRGVSLNKLRKIIADINGLKLGYENHHFFFEMSDGFYSDYADINKLLEEVNESSSSNGDVFREIVNIITKGQFLAFCDFSYLDSFKSEMEDKILKIIAEQLVAKFKKEEYHLVIQLAKLIYQIDPLNEFALNHELTSYLKKEMEIEARKRFNLFLVDYQKEYNEPYRYTFNEQTIDRAPKTINNNRSKSKHFNF